MAVFVLIVYCVLALCALVPLTIHVVKRYFMDSDEPPGL